MAEDNTIAKLTEQLEAEKAKNKALTKAAEESNRVIADLQSKVGAVPAKKDMKQYLVEVTCYWNDRFFRKDDIAEIPKGVTPPKEYFSEIKA